MSAPDSPATARQPRSAVNSALVGAVGAGGFAIVDNVLSDPVIEEVGAALEVAGPRSGTQRRGGVVAIRNLLAMVPAIAQLARSAPVRRIAEEVLGPNCFAVRGILFDKTPLTNWKVAWHQDLTIAVQRRIDVAGFGPWSEKAGVACVQPPLPVLQNMLSLRPHLDACGADNAPLLVLPGSHARGA